MKNQEVEITVVPEALNDDEILRKKVAGKLKVDARNIQRIDILRMSLDARKKPPIYRVRLVLNAEEAWLNDWRNPPSALQNVKSGDRSVIIIGFGPAGMFAALELLRHGIRPIVLERGSSVRDRRRDVVKIFRDREVDPDSNYCFGEGGAGTFSDGKLYTRSKKRGNIRSVLNTLVEHGADPAIMYDARPHIGTNKLPGIVENIRESIESKGGEVHFNTKVTDLIIENDVIQGVQTEDKDWMADDVILATGHSARDIFRMLQRNGVKIEAKPFALGVRIEHPQDLIDRIQYRCLSKDTALPPAAYSIVRQVDRRGVFSFCMCPGGIIAPAMTGSNEVVVNGWSPSKRNGEYANSGFVVQIEPEDWQSFDKEHGPLAAMHFQSLIERSAFDAGGSDLSAPAQIASDFIKKRTSGKLPNCSYIPGIKNSDLWEVLPEYIASRLRGALVHFDKRMRGYAGENAVMVGVESRTSSPVRIPRDRESLQHEEIRGLYPVGEGAGYAGGIMSAAIDGISVAEKIGERYCK